MYHIFCLNKNDIDTEKTEKKEEDFNAHCVERNIQIAAAGSELHSKSNYVTNNNNVV